VPTAATAAEKLAVDAPAATMTEDGTDMAALLLLRATLTPPLGAPVFNVAVHAVVAAPVMVEFAQLSDCSFTCLRILSDDRDLTAKAASVPG